MHRTTQRLASLSHGVRRPGFTLFLLINAIVMAPSVANAVDPLR
jgi:hypothetical protein